MIDCEIHGAQSGNVCPLCPYAIVKPIQEQIPYMPQEPNKYFSPIHCPECKSIFYLVLKLGEPELSETLTLEQVETFKKLAKLAADGIKDPEEKKQFIESVEDPAYILDKEELEKITKEI